MSALVTSCQASPSRHASSSSPSSVRRLSDRIAVAASSSSTIASRTWPDLAGDRGGRGGKGGGGGGGRGGGGGGPPGRGRGGTAGRGGGTGGGGPRSRGMPSS